MILHVSLQNCDTDLGQVQGSRELVQTGIQGRNFTTMPYIYIYQFVAKNNMTMRNSIQHLKHAKPRLALFLHKITRTCCNETTWQWTFTLFMEAYCNILGYNVTKLANYLVKSLGPDYGPISRILMNTAVVY
jgi:hypothetical protein